MYINIYTYTYIYIYIHIHIRIPIHKTTYLHRLYTYTCMLFAFITRMRKMTAQQIKHPRLPQILKVTSLLNLIRITTIDPTFPEFSPADQRLSIGKNSQKSALLFICTADSEGGCFSELLPAVWEFPKMWRGAAASHKRWYLTKIRKCRLYSHFTEQTQ